MAISLSFSLNIGLGALLTLGLRIGWLRIAQITLLNNSLNNTIYK